VKPLPVLVPELALPPGGTTVPLSAVLTSSLADADEATPGVAVVEVGRAVAAAADTCGATGCDLAGSGSLPGACAAALDSTGAAFEAAVVAAVGFYDANKTRTDNKQTKCATVETRTIHDHDPINYGSTSCV
jgi:hypothetical protein